MTASRFYLGKHVDPATGALGARLELDPADLLTHGVIVGMTGSGKTGLGIVLIEEALRAGIPVLAIDPKGDLANLLLLFDDLSPAAFAPWVDPGQAHGEGRSVEAAAEEAASRWKAGLQEWGLSAADVAALRSRQDAVILTPGSSAGVGVNVLQSLAAPPMPFAAAEEDLRDEIAGFVAGLLGLLGREDDPLQSRESILLSTLIEHAWREGRGLSLEALLAGVADPPFERLGALPVESVYPRAERHRLMLALNNLLAAPGFEAWREGCALDMERLLGAAGAGRPRLTILSIAHLQDAERLFVTALVLDKVKTWMRRQGGTTSLRALVYMDEVFGYLPPHPANPPTKRPLLTLLKQARAQGVGIVLATQNPVDLDYKALTNAGTWMVGTLQTEQDRARLREGLQGAGLPPAALERLLGAVRPRVFLLHDVHRPGPALLHSRWALSYLRGPLTRDEIARLMRGRAAEPAAAAEAPAGEAAPALPAPFQHHYLRRHGAAVANAHLLVKYAVRYPDAGEEVLVQAWPLGEGGAAEALESEPISVDEAAVTRQAPAELRYGPLPPALAGGGRQIEKVLRERLHARAAADAWYDPVTQAASRPGETRQAFAARLQAEGGGRAAGKLEDALARKTRELAQREQELSGRRLEKWAAVGSAVLANLGLLTGRRRTVSGAAGVFSKNRMENATESRVEALRAERAALEAELAAVRAVDPARLEPRRLAPARGGVAVLRWDLLWVY